MSEEQEPLKDEVVVVEVTLDDRPLEYILTDIFEVRERRYATLYCDEDFLEDEDRTLFARVDEVDGEDRFDILGESDELEMVVANATIGVLDDLLLSVRSQVRSLARVVTAIDQGALQDKEKQELSIVYSGLVDLLDLLNAPPLDQEEEDDDE